MRGRDGRLTHLQIVWHAEAERDREGGPAVVTATASTVDKVWSRLRTSADLAGIRTRSGDITPRAASSAPR